MPIKAAVLGTIVLAGALVGSMGAVHIEVKPKKPGGEHIWVVAPAILLPAGAMVVPKAKVRQASREIRQWLPAIRAAVNELGRCPDGPFVQVDDRHEHVRIVKIDGALVIDVDDETETVHVSIPLSAAAYACDRLVEVAETPDDSPRSQPI